MDPTTTTKLGNCSPQSCLSWQSSLANLHHVGHPTQSHCPSQSHQPPKKPNRFGIHEQSNTFSTNNSKINILNKLTRKTEPLSLSVADVGQVWWGEG